MMRNLPPKGVAGLAAMRGERLQALAAAAGHDDGQRAAGESADIATGRCAGRLAWHGLILQPFHEAQLVRMRKQLMPGEDAHLGRELPALQRLGIEGEHRGPVASCSPVAVSMALHMPSRGASS